MFNRLVVGRSSVAHPLRHSGAWRGAGPIVLASLLAACSSPTTLPPAPGPSGSGSGSGSAASGDPTSTSSAGAGGASTGAGPSWSCTGDAAYWATSTAFTSPTAEKLAAALDELVYPYDARPISIVLRQNGSIRKGAASATKDEGGTQVFVAPGPALVSLDETAEGFGNAAPQPDGALTLAQPQGPLQIALQEIRWRARPNDGCNSAWISLDAVIPASEGATVLHLATGSASIAELAAVEGGPDGGLTGYPVHAWFLGESMVFDFASLPGSP